MALHHRVGRLEIRTALSRACPLCSTGPSVVRIVPGPAVSCIAEATVQHDPSDWCRCGRKVVYRIAPPPVARAGA